MKGLQISFVSPVYKAEKTLSELVKQIIENIVLITENFEIILIEGSSHDHTWLEIEKECLKDNRIKGIQLSRNFGQYAAINAGLKYALSEKIIIMDSELQDNPQDILKLCLKSQEDYDQEDYDTVMARRTNGKDYIIQKTLNIAIENYGVKLIPLVREKIEMVRQWRNDPKISQHMEYREYITPEMQQKWFESICNSNNYYFIIELENKEIGMINTKNIDYIEMSGEGGIFIYDDFYLNSDVAFRASLCNGDFLTEIIKLNNFYIYIFRQNKKAINYNKMLGYKLLDGQENIEKQKYVSSKEDYFRQRDIITKIIS